MRVSRQNLLPLLMWLLPLSFFGFQFIFRLWPSLMMNQIMVQFSIGATEFGLLASVYYYGYAGMQIPIAISLERWEVRYIVFFAAITCGVATMLFTYTNIWYLALLSRFLIGAGSAAGFLATSKVISQWFNKESYAKMVGFSFSIGLLGAIYGGQPVSILITNHPWQLVNTMLAGISILIAVLSLLFLRTPNKKLVRQVSDSQNDTINFSDFKYVFKSKFIWFLAIANLLLVGALEGFADVWGVNYLQVANNISREHAAGLVSMIFVGMLFGGPILAFFSKYLGKYNVIAMSGVMIASLFNILLYYSGNSSSFDLSVMFMLIGILCCYQVIVFAIGNDIVSGKLLGVTVAFLNCINMLGGSFFHSTIGVLMDFTWNGAMNPDGTKFYQLSSYTSALSVIPVCALVGSLIVMLLGFITKSSLDKDSQLDRIVAKSI